MRAFLIVAVGQFISLTGSIMTQFALGIWIWQKTGEATPFTWIAVANALPILFSPLIGALVDRWDRRLTMMLSDLGAGAVTILYFLLLSADQLQVWHLYAGAFVASVFGLFQWPAYSAAIAVMVPKDQYTRANALHGLAESASGILAPALAAGLIALIGIQGVMALDIISFVAAIGTLLFIAVPRTERSAAGAAANSGGMLSEMAFGFRYILARRSLLGLQMVFLFGNLMATMAFTLQAPMILARTGNDEGVLGVALSALGIGGLVGGLFLSAWGGPKRRVHGVLGGWFFSSLCGMLLVGLGRTLPVWAVAGFFSSIIVAAVNGSNQAIWQAKVPPDVQGKVFAIRRMIAWSGNWIAALIAGPLADGMMEPAMREGGALTGVFGPLVGTGPGAGMALILVFAGIGGMLVGVIGYLTPVVRDAEDRLPDHDAVIIQTASP
ncbi:MAG: MFS transporter [Anaerolineae bacterium]|nr:MFS transporter [Anaerolineae bacterium]